MPAIVIENYKVLDSQVSEVVFARAKARPNPANLEMAALVKKCGSYLELQTQLIWRRWRLEQDKQTIADDLGMPRWRVAQALTYIRRTAVRLGLVPGMARKVDGRAENNRRMGADPVIKEKRRQSAVRQWANTEIRARMAEAQRRRRARERTKHEGATQSYNVKEALSGSCTRGAQ